ncbi:DUF805 domain-containing protein [Megasphaera sp. UPII 135-E]|uniref:DUF805 domain-containing protein n=1 Tax=Megasphaera sp. UPII 135-E TaxID=1000569 RepID=UPI00021A2D7C|nr:DUF805 domain-containing protein [Megasphaera sp. UPII 135-E]EGS35656.1 hypothetical protein HMPREF1040_0128 [Megasphaera sp. UPII 135-E]
MKQVQEDVYKQNQGMIACFFSCQGCLRQKQYVWRMIALALVGMIASSLIQAQGMDAVVGGILAIVAGISGITLGIRRFHDLGKTGWWMILGVIPGVNIGVVLYLLGTSGMYRTQQYSFSKVS